MFVELLKAEEIYDSKKDTFSISRERFLLINNLGNSPYEKPLFKRKNIQSCSFQSI